MCIPKMIEHIVLHENEYKVLCLSTQHSVVFEVDKKMWRNYVIRGSKSTLGKYLTEIGLDEKPNTSQDVSQALDYTNLIINLTSQCNFTCVYCFRDTTPQKISFDNFDKALDLVPMFFNKERCTIQFFGGEPLLLFKQIQKMTTHAKGKLQNHRLTFSITTNGSLIVPEIAQFLADNNFTVTISLDSFQEVNSQTRSPLRGDPKKVYENIIENIKLLLSLGINLSCNVVVTVHNVQYLYGFITYLYKLGIRRVSLSLVSDKQFPITDSFSNTLLEQEAKIINFLLVTPDFSLDPISLLMGFIKSHQLYLYRCGYGRLRVNIQPNGAVTPCQRVYTPIGNLIDGIDVPTSMAIALDSVDNRPVCKQCAFRYLCGGNCYHESQVHEYNLYQPYYPYCAYFARLVSLISVKMIQASPLAIEVDGLKVL